MVHEHKVNGIYFKMTQIDGMVKVTWSHKQTGDSKTWPGLLPVKGNSVNRLKTISHYIKGEYA